MSGSPDTGSEAHRVAGHCVVCNEVVERREDGSCPAGHAPAAIAGQIRLGPAAPLPRLPTFNWGAFFLPPIWGIAHGLWAGVFFLPLWVFVDNAIKGTAGRPVWMQVLAWLTLAGTLGFQYEYARTANRLAWRRACRRMEFLTYVRRERCWAVGGAVTIGVLGVWVALFLTR